MHARKFSGAGGTRALLLPSRPLRRPTTSFLATTLGLSLWLACERRETELPAPPPPALHETPAASVEDLCDPELRSWAVLDAELQIVAHTRGACLGVVEHPEDGRLWQFVAQLQDADDDSPSWELHMWLDADGLPRHAEFRTPELVTRFAWHEGTLAVHRLGDVLAIEDAAQLWVTPAHAVYVRELMLRLGVGRTATGLVQRGFAPERDAIVELALTLEQLDANLAQARIDAGVIGLARIERGLAGVQVTSVLAGDAPIYRPLERDALANSLPAIPRPHYEPPGSVELIPIEIAGTGEKPTLAGELVVAAGSAEPPTRRPAVLFIAGAGPQDRHGIVPESSVDIGSHALHDALAVAGFAVLRVDDRGVGGSSIGDDPTPGFLGLVDDARRALASLAAHPLVDPQKIVLIGHGEGALVASMLAGEGVRAGGRKRSIGALVLLAGPGRNLRELIYDEIRATHEGQSEGEIRTAVDRARRVHDAALANEELPASSEGARRWMVEAFAEDPLARLAKVRAPILALQGGKDFQVSPARDFEPIRAHVEKRGGKGSAAELLPELDHLFKHEPGISTPGHYADLRRRMEPGVIEHVVSWALAITRSNTD
jgi:pimeloyl-ACP methyl ester carboxylesterase